LWSCENASNVSPNGMIERKVRELLEDQSSVKISEVIAAIPEYKKEEKKFVKAALRKLGFRDRGYGIWTKPSKSALNLTFVVYSNKKI
jgi:hypothetical protein